MPDFFPRFACLPAELRLDIWRQALAQGQSVNSFQRNGQQIICVTHGRTNPQAIAQSCCDAQAIMQSVYTKIDLRRSTRLREIQVLSQWLNFDRQIFCFRDWEYDDGLMGQLAAYGLLERICYLALKPRDCWGLFRTVDEMKKYCRALQAVVVVAPWLGNPRQTERQTYGDFEDELCELIGELGLASSFPVTADEALEERMKDWPGGPPRVRILDHLAATGL